MMEIIIQIFFGIHAFQDEEYHKSKNEMLWIKNDYIIINIDNIINIDIIRSIYYKNIIIIIIIE
mgnify:CR=1 FL=1